MTVLHILDGGLATELEKRGANLNHELWSAKLLYENPQLIKQVHFDVQKNISNFFPSFTRPVPVFVQQQAIKRQCKDLKNWDTANKKRRR